MQWAYWLNTFKLYELSNARAGVIAVKTANQQELERAIQLINSQTLIPSLNLLCSDDLNSQMSKIHELLIDKNFVPAFEVLICDSQDIKQVLANSQQALIDLEQIMILMMLIFLPMQK